MQKQEAATLDNCSECKVSAGRRSWLRGKVESHRKAEILIFKIFLDVCMYAYVLCEYLVPTEVREAAVKDSCEPSCGCREVNLVLCNNSQCS